MLPGKQEYRFYQPTFRLIINDPRLIKVAKILETPGGIEMHTENITRLRGLWAG